MNGMYQCAGAKEQECLEHGVREQVEHRGHISESGIVNSLYGLVVCHA